MKAVLVLENGAVFVGRAFSGAGEVVAPLAFNSNMAGYQEAITDPGHMGRMLCFTYPLIGSYGVNDEDSLSSSVQVKAVLVKEYISTPRNFRAQGSLADFLARQGVLGVEALDTRAVTRLLSQNGPMLAAVSTTAAACCSVLVDKSELPEAISCIPVLIDPTPSRMVLTVSRRPFCIFCKFKHNRPISLLPDTLTG